MSLEAEISELRKSIDTLIGVLSKNPVQLELPFVAELEQTLHEKFVETQPEQTVVATNPEETFEPVEAKSYTAQEALELSLTHIRADVNKKEKVRLILQGYGARTITNLDKKYYPEFLTKLEQL